MTKVARPNTRQISKRAHELYDEEIGPKVETDENIGKIIVIDVQSGHYEVDTDGIEANRRLRARYPDIDPYHLFAIRIGYDAVYAVGGSVTRTARK